MINEKACDAGAVLSSMRNRRGEPNLRIRLLAGLVALLLAGPVIALAVFRAVAGVFSLAL
ncbi:MAG: hypothetical protein QOE05_3432 [Actinomycetota bacterium]|nr:hypothetical protein [Actinomycetota bacterium]